GGISLDRPGARAWMHRNRVKIRAASIFNGLFESRNFAKNRKNPAKKREKTTGALAVYRDPVNHRRLYLSLYRRFIVDRRRKRRPAASLQQRATRRIRP